MHACGRVCGYGNAVGPQSLLTVFGNTPHVSTPCCSSIQDISIPLLNNLLSSHPSTPAPVSAPELSCVCLALLQLFSFFKTNNEKQKKKKKKKRKNNATQFVMGFKRRFKRMTLTSSLSFTKSCSLGQQKFCRFFFLNSEMKPFHW